MALETARLLVSCPDTKGIIAAVTSFVADQDGNIIEADQYSDPQRGEFFMRAEIELGSFRLKRETFAPAWEPVV